MTESLDALIRRAGEVARETGDAREAAWEASVAACRAMERALVAALDGESIAGMRNLARLPIPPNWQPIHHTIASGAATFRAPWNGAQVRRKDIWDPLPIDTPVLCLVPSGRLMMAVYASTQVKIDSVTGAARQRDRLVTAWPAEDDDLLAEDAAPFARALGLVIHEHLGRCQEKAMRYHELENLALRLRGALG